VINQCGFTVVDVGYNGNVANLLSWKHLRPICANGVKRQCLLSISGVYLFGTGYETNLLWAHGFDVMRNLSCFL
jgi:hypothetical protein